MNNDTSPLAARSGNDIDALWPGLIGKGLPGQAGARRALSARAQALLDASDPAGGLSAQLARPYLVKGWLDRGGVSVLYGPSNTGKSFLALDIAHHVAKGEGWGGRRVNRGNVLYVAAEGGATFDNRVAALEEPRFWVLRAGLSLVGPLADAEALAEMIGRLTETHGAYDLIVLDTLARVMGAADENAAPDIAALVASLDALRAATGAHVMLVHHSGKDLSRGARGHSSLRAAIDTEIVLARDEEAGEVTATVEKQRDGPTGARFAFRLRQVELGEDQDGDPVTTCRVAPLSGPAAAGLRGPARKALAALAALLEAEGEVQRAPHLPGGPSVPVRRWAAACGEEGLTAKGGREAERKAFQRARRELEDAGAVCVRDESVWRVEDLARAERPQR